MNDREFSLSLTEAILRSQVTGEGKKAAEGPPRFTITISREVGALGTSVATELGKRLGWHVYDQEIINKIAEEAGRPAFHVRSVDEKYFHWLADSLTGLFTDYHFPQDVYLKKLIATIHGLGVVGNCIIVGRGSTFILPPESTIRVRLVADLKDRVVTIGRLRGISDRDAARWIDKTEQERNLFIRKNFEKEPNDPHLYDLILNMSRISIADAAEQIVALLRAFERARAEEARPAS